MLLGRPATTLSVEWLCCTGRVLSTGIIEDMSDVLDSAASTDVVFRTSVAVCVSSGVVVSVYWLVVDAPTTFSMLVLAGT